MAQGLRTSTRRRFKQQKSPEGKPWVPSIRVATSGGVTLTKTARLRNSIGVKASHDGFAVGTNVVYAARHQFGDKRPVKIRAKTKKGLRFMVGGRWITKQEVSVKMPARPFLGIGEQDMAEIKDTLEEVVERSGR